VLRRAHGRVGRDDEASPPCRVAPFSTASGVNGWCDIRCVLRVMTPHVENDSEQADVMALMLEIRWDIKDGQEANFKSNHEAL
jgi:hypothetical protein